MWSPNQVHGYGAAAAGGGTKRSLQQTVSYGRQSLISSPQIAGPSTSYHQQAVNPSIPWLEPRLGPMQRQQARSMQAHLQNNQNQATDFSRVKIAIPSSTANEAETTPSTQPGQPTSELRLAQFNNLKVSAASAIATEAKKKRKTTTTVTTTTTNRKQTKVYKGSSSGGQAHKEAAARGESEKFEGQVQEKIASMGVCAAGYEWYKCSTGGYLCGGGNHFICFDEIDKWAKCPSHDLNVELVNSPLSALDNVLDDGRVAMLAAHPPPVDLWQPMHEQHQKFVEWCVDHGYVQIADGDSSYDRAKFRTENDTDESDGCDCIEKLRLMDSLRKLSPRSPRPRRLRRFGQPETIDLGDDPFDGMSGDGFPKASGAYASRHRCRLRARIGSGYGGFDF